MELALRSFNPARTTFVESA
uniref:Uncharacterized protein n=1 Tax=Arundo donax TaxID=35708 RepID=A0A0A8YEW6_ARUDO